MIIKLKPSRSAHSSPARSTPPPQTLTPKSRTQNLKLYTPNLKPFAFSPEFFQPQSPHSADACLPARRTLQGYLAHKKPRPPRTLQ